MSRAAKVAAIDIGTNSVLLTIAARGANGPEALVDRATITRLGEGVDRTRQLAPAAVERNLACLSAYAAELAAHGSPPLDVVGTSALRDAQGAPAFLDEAERILGKRPRVIAGDEEAALTFRGALSGLDVSGPLLVFDVGGGSTELIRDGGERRVSLDIGSVRLFERHVHADPPAASEMSAIEADVARALDGAASLFDGADGTVTLVGVAGTVTTLKSIELGLAHYDAARVHGAALTLSDVESLCAKLASLPLERRQHLAGLQPKRADVIVAGAVIVRDVLRRSGATQLIVSDRGVRYGLLEQLLTD